MSHNPIYCFFTKAVASWVFGKTVKAIHLYNSSHSDICLTKEEAIQLIGLLECSIREWEIYEENEEQT